MKNKEVIAVEVLIHASIDTVWKFWTTPSDIIKWNNASEDWHTTSAHNDLTEGGEFFYRMEAKDASMGFDFKGVYDKVIEKHEINYTIEDDRKVKIIFLEIGDNVQIAESFESENFNTIELQKQGWQAILDNFKKYVENNFQKK